jgi:hypothetical protein
MTRPTPTIDYNVPTAVLAAKTKNFSTSNSPTPVVKQTKVLGTKSFNPAIIIFSAGGVIMLICGILAYLRYKRNGLGL